MCCCSSHQTWNRCHTPLHASAPNASSARRNSEPSTPPVPPRASRAAVGTSLTSPHQTAKGSIRCLPETPLERMRDGPYKTGATAPSPSPSSSSRTSSPRMKSFNQDDGTNEKMLCSGLRAFAAHEAASCCRACRKLSMACRRFVRKASTNLERSAYFSRSDANEPLASATKAARRCGSGIVLDWVLWPGAWSLRRYNTR
mmetsp:Transcript_72710/g.224584  ORF Transcript_72710/g.224584 Transcript_72710/m.224584 type:complete len:200 (-) Transcript_72710:1789-2388(-)